MGLGGRKGRPRVFGVVVILIMLLSVAVSIRVEATSDGNPLPPTYLPLVFVSPPLGREPSNNPACTSSRPGAAIYGIVYIDTNRNGQYEPDEALGGWDVPVEGARVQLQRADWAEPLTALSSDGYYCFEELEPGDYTITVTLAAKDQLVLESLNGESDNIRILANEAIARDFRYERWYRPPPGLPFTLYFPVVAR